MSRFLVAVALVAVLAALPAGVSSAAGAPPSASNARTATLVRMWRANLHAGALAQPRRRFPNPPTSTLLERLRFAATQYQFRVERVEILRPVQAAPFVLVEADDERALSRATRSILQLIDPKKPADDDRTGWAYEGFFFEALSSRGVPFLATFNWWRGPHAGGGQWASDESLYPFPHG